MPKKKKKGARKIDKVAEETEVLKKRKASKKKTKKIPEEISEKKWKKINFEIKNWKTLVLVLVAFLLLVGDLFLFFSGKKATDTPAKKTSSQTKSTQIPEDKPSSPEFTEAEDAAKIKEITDTWITYTDPLYNFELKYPSDWGKPQTEKLIGKQFSYQYKISFSGLSSEKENVGFDFYIYEPKAAVSFLDPKYSINLVPKNPAAIAFDTCKTYTDTSIGIESYPAKELKIEKDDPCFKENYFFRFLKGSYLYDVVPNLEKQNSYQKYEGEETVKKSFKEFYYILGTLKFITEPKPVVKKITPIVRKAAAAPRRGRLTCAHPGSKPQKSKQHKGIHTDEDCCPDPDERPNPACAYSAKDLGIMK